MLAKTLQARGDTEHPIVRKGYNYEQEVRRKANLEKLFLRTKEQQDKEREFLEEAKKLEKKIKKEEKDFKNLERIIQSDNMDAGRGQEGEEENAETGIAQTSRTSGGRGGRRDRGSHVYLRSQKL